MEDQTLNSYISDLMDRSLSTISENGVEVDENTVYSQKQEVAQPQKQQPQPAAQAEEWPEDEDFLEGVEPPPDDIEISLEKGLVKPSSASDWESIDMSSERFYDDEDNENAPRRKRRCALPLVCLFVMLGIAALVVGITMSRDESDGSSRAAINESNEAATGAGAGAGSETDENLNGGTDSVPPVASPTTPSPTKSPVESPTPSPTQAPTASPAPTVCVAMISTNADCYNRNLADDIVVSFEQCDPRGDDWVGIYVSGADGTVLGEDYLEWSFACGSQDCNAETRKNTIALDLSIEPGMYQVFLARENDNGAPYSSILASEQFLITDGECFNS